MPPRQVLYIKTDRAKFTGLRSLVWLASESTVPLGSSSSSCVVLALPTEPSSPSAGSIIALSLFVKSSTALNKALY